MNEPIPPTPAAPTPVGQPSPQIPRPVASAAPPPPPQPGQAGRPAPSAPAREPAQEQTTASGATGLPVAAATPPVARTPVGPRALGRELRGPARLGLAIVLVFFGVGGTWSATAPISGAVIASGVISPEGSRKNIQHLEGGIIREIRVREGDRVEAGQVLVVLEDVIAQAELGQQKARLRTLAAAEARLRAERAEATEVHFDHPSLADRSNPDVRAAMEQEINQFNTRRLNDQGRINVLSQRIAQLEQQIIGAQRQITAVRRQNELIREEIVAKKAMFEKGFETKPKLLELQRKEAELLGDDGELVSRVARAQEQIGETRLQMLNVKVERAEEVDRTLAETQAQRSEVEQRIRESEDRLSRTTIVAPVAGTVLDMRFKTIGGVVRAGEEVLDIVPGEDALIVDAQLSPKDVEAVHAGQHGYVIFPSFPQRNLHRIDARVRFVSADAKQDERTGQRYYTAKIEVNREQLHRLDPQIELVPGMPAEAFISTEARTLLDYLIQPYLIVIERSMREH